MNDIAGIELNNGTTIPQMGFGVFQIPPQDTQAAVEAALEVGYRSIDTATAYGNEAEVGLAVRAPGLDRSELFVTTKLWNTDHASGEARPAFERSLDALGNVVIPKTVNPDRMRENLGAVDVVLDDEDLTRIGSLDGAGRRGPHPDEFDLV